MNFLSHYYFEKESLDENLIIGVILPDLVKNAHKDCNLYPQKNEHIFTADHNLNALLTGWKKHLEVDRLFHSSVFFAAQTALLKEIILPLLNQSKVRPSFLAHIGVELVLDHLLLVNHKVNVTAFYQQINAVNKNNLSNFLLKSGMANTDKFLNFLEKFTASEYLFNYQKLENIAYALNRICMRIWENPLTPAQISQLAEKLSIYKKLIENDFMLIFEEIENSLI